MSSDADTDPFYDRLQLRFDPAVWRTFTRPQLEAMRAVFGAGGWRQHSLDIRLSVPFFWRRYYLVMLGGRDLRSEARRALEPPKHPFASFGNAIVTVVCGAALAVLVLIAADLLLELARTGAGEAASGSSLFDALGEQFGNLFK